MLRPNYFYLDQIELRLLKFLRKKRKAAEIAQFIQDLHETLPGKHLDRRLVDRPLQSLKLRGALTGALQVNAAVVPTHCFEGTEAELDEIYSSLKAAGLPVLSFGTLVGFGAEHRRRVTAAARLLFDQRVAGWHRQYPYLVPKVISEAEYREAAKDALPADLPVYLLKLGFLKEDSATVIERLQKARFRIIHDGKETGIRGGEAEYKRLLKYLWKKRIAGWQNHADEIVVRFEIATESEFDTALDGYFRDVWLDKRPGWGTIRSDLTERRICTERQFDSEVEKAEKRAAREAARRKKEQAKAEAAKARQEAKEARDRYQAERTEKAQHDRLLADARLAYFKLRESGRAPIPLAENREWVRAEHGGSKFWVRLAPLRARTRDAHTPGMG
jgi:hypothetical protein